MTPRWPTAQPLRAEGKLTAVSVTLTGTAAWRQVLPWSSDSTTTPRSPTATNRGPALVTPSRKACAGLATRVAGRLSVSATSAAHTPPAAAPRANAAIRARRPAFNDNIGYFLF